MKLLESSRFEMVNSALFVENGDNKVQGRIESYSCKMIGTDKQLYKKFNAGAEGRSPQSLEALSPPTNGFGCYGQSPKPHEGNSIRQRSYSRGYSSSPSEEDEGISGGNSTIREDAAVKKSLPTLCDAISRKTLFHLISTLNAAFSDYDFTDTKASDFTKEPNLKYVMNNVDNLLSVTATDKYAKVHDRLWATLNEEIVLPQCDIYSYDPDLMSDPYGEAGSLWSFNYFFYNRKLKRIVFFTCRGLSPFGQTYDEYGKASPMHPEYGMDDNDMD